MTLRKRTGIPRTAIGVAFKGVGSREAGWEKRKEDGRRRTVAAAEEERQQQSMA